jgi:hypothetical protein
MRRSLAICLMLGCDPPEPVLSGIPETAILAEAPSKDANPIRSPKIYIKAEDISVDIRHLCGKPIERVRTELHEQLGARQSSRALNANQGVEYQHTRGRIRVHGGVIYMMSVPLNQPRYRREALQLMGFPPFTGGVIRTSREYRINNEWDFRRIRLKRMSRDAEQVTEVEVWRWLPRERQ